MCESDRRCQNFLKKTYPGIPIWDDVRTFDGTRWRGTFLLTAGVPCQSASRAGKQGGEKDDRWLWPEAIRIVDEARPRWCLFENPPGIYDVGIDGILADLEGIGYSTGIVEIPACAVNAPHRRARVWIVAHNISIGRNATISFARTPECLDGQSITKDESKASQGDVANCKSWRCKVGAINSEETRSNGRLSNRRYSLEKSATQGDMADAADARLEEQTADENGLSDYPKQDEFWNNSIWLPCADGKLRRAPDSSFMLVDGVQPGVHQHVGEGEKATWATPKNTVIMESVEQWQKRRRLPGKKMMGPSLPIQLQMTKAQTVRELGLHRSILAGLGNSIVPAVAFEIIKAIKKASNETM